MIARVTIAAAALLALGILCASCGGDDSNDPLTNATTSPPPTTTNVPRDEPANPSTGGSAAPHRTKTDSSGDRDGGSVGGGTRDQPVSPAGDDRPRRAGKRKSAKRVSRDVYKAGKQACFIFGIDQIRQEYELVQRSPEAVARFYADLFEKANPQLIAPYYQGCLQGFHQRAARDRRANER